MTPPLPVSTRVHEVLALGEFLVWCPRPALEVWGLNGGGEGISMPPYKELYPIGTKVRVASRAKLKDFLRTWKWHNPLAPEQLVDAGRAGKVVNVGFYFGGDVLYDLLDIAGIWHEECLTPAEEE
jgi:hypothetical protein